MKKSRRRLEISPPDRIRTGGEKTCFFSDKLSSIGPTLAKKPGLIILAFLPWGRGNYEMQNLSVILLEKVGRQIVNASCITKNSAARLREDRKPANLPGRLQ
jgi:hypothetical protein